MTTPLSLLDRDWVSANLPLVLQGIRQLGQDAFTSDDLRRFVSEEPSNVNLWGVLVAHLRALKAIRHVGYQTSTRPEANGRVIRSFVAR